VSSRSIMAGLASRHNREGTVPAVTYYVAIPFVRSEDGELVAGEAIEVQGGVPAAISKAGQLSIKNAGAIAFARTGDPALGEFQPAIILARYGETPNEVE